MRPDLYFIRHGQTDWNAERRFQGREEAPLNAAGRTQALRNGRLLAQVLQHGVPADFVSSPQLRARQTMEIIRGALGMQAGGYRTDDRLVEVDFGAWQGLTEEEIRTRFSDLHQARMRDKWHFTPPGAGAESYAQQAVRVREWLEEIDTPTLCVAHGGVLRCILVLAAGFPEDEAGQIDIPQDRVLLLRGARAEWL